MVGTIDVTTKQIFFVQGAASERFLSRSQVVSALKRRIAHANRISRQLSADGRYVIGFKEFSPGHGPGIRLTSLDHTGIGFGRLSSRGVLKRSRDRAETASSPASGKTLDYHQIATAVIDLVVQARFVRPARPPNPRFGRPQLSFAYVSRVE